MRGKKAEVACEAAAAFTREAINLALAASVAEFGRALKRGDAARERQRAEQSIGERVEQERDHAMRRCTCGPITRQLGRGE